MCLRIRFHLCGMTTWSTGPGILLVGPGVACDKLYTLRRVLFSGVNNLLVGPETATTAEITLVVEFQFFIVHTPTRFAS